MADELRTVTDYMLRFQKDLIRYFPDEEPGLRNTLELIGEFVARDKRKIILYVAQGPPATTEVVTRITYVMPVSEAASRLFNSDEELIAPEGPNFTTFDDLARRGQTAQQFMETNIATIPGMADWLSEVRRIRAAYGAEEKGLRKSTMKNILVFWKDMRSRVYDMIYQAGIRMPRTSSGRTRTRTGSGTRRRASSRASNIRSHRSTSGSRRSNYTRSNRSRTPASSPRYVTPELVNADPTAFSSSKRSSKKGNTDPI
jgi:hypothetical protein